MTVTVAGNVKLDIALSALRGRIHGWADVGWLAWCTCGWFCGYVCTNWGNVWNADLVSFPGFAVAQNLLNLSGQTTLR